MDSIENWKKIGTNIWKNPKTGSTIFVGESIGTPGKFRVEYIDCRPKNRCIGKDVGHLSSSRTSARKKAIAYLKKHPMG